METKFTQTAAEHRLYLFRLLEPSGLPRPFTVLRNGVSLEMTGEMTLLMNPEEINKEHKARTAPVQTPHGSWVDSYGMGLPKWTIRGTMGFNAKPAFGVVGPSSQLDGYSGFHAFSDMIEEYFEENRRRAIEAATGAGVNGLLRLEFIDTFDDDAWTIEPEGLPTKRRATSHNSIIRYDFSFTGIQDLRVRPARQKVEDPVGMALLGNVDRQRAIGRAINAHLGVVEQDLAALEELERTAPGLSSEMQEIMACSVTTQYSESPDGLTHRQTILGVGADTESELSHTLAQAKGLGSVSPGIESAVLASMAESRAFAGSSSCAPRADLVGAKGEWSSKLVALSNSSSAGAGDDYILSVFSAGKVASLGALGESATSALQSAAPGNASGIPLFSSASSFIRSVIAPVSGLGNEVLSVASGAKGAIDTNLSTVNIAVQNMRKSLSSVQAALYQLRAFSSAASRLRAIKRSLTQYMCAIQSILAFPYLFARDLKQGLQALLDLFELSGCATSFPNLKPLSWQPSLRLPKVILP